MLRRALLLSAALLALTASPALAARYVAGSDGSGDPYFPLAGNGGYDARHYGLDLDVRPPRRSASTVGRSCCARATQDLSRFNLDLRDLLHGRRASAVNGKRADFDHAGQELSIDRRGPS